MDKQLPYKDLCTLIAARSICAVQVGSLIYDHHGIISWGWNHSGHTGNGAHAESEAIKRANRKRLRGSTIITVAIRRRKIINSFPCPNCYARIRNAQIRFVECHNHLREWMRYKI